jgi:hypothetical protein
LVLPVQHHFQFGDFRRWGFGDESGNRRNKHKGGCGRERAAARD